MEVLVFQHPYTPWVWQPKLFMRHGSGTRWQINQIVKCKKKQIRTRPYLDQFYPDNILVLLLVRLCRVHHWRLHSLRHGIASHPRSTNIAATSHFSVQYFFTIPSTQRHIPRHIQHHRMINRYRTHKKNSPQTNAEFFVCVRPSPVGAINGGSTGSSAGYRKIMFMGK